MAVFLLPDINNVEYSEIREDFCKSCANKSNEYSEKILHILDAILQVGKK